MLNRFNLNRSENSQNPCSFCLKKACGWGTGLPLGNEEQLFHGHTHTQADMILPRWTVQGSHKWNRLSVEHDKETPPNGKRCTGIADWPLFGWCHSWIRLLRHTLSCRSVICSHMTPPLKWIIKPVKSRVHVYNAFACYISHAHNQKSAWGLKYGANALHCFFSSINIIVTLV